MRCISAMLVLCCVATFLAAQERSAGPVSDKAKKSYAEAQAYLRERRIDAALDSFKKADKQDGGRCIPCEKGMIKYGLQLQEWKTAEMAAGEIVAQAQNPRAEARAHYDFGMVWMTEGMVKHKSEAFALAHEEMTKALAAIPRFPEALFADGQALAHLNQDDLAKARFQQFVDKMPADNVDRQRALRFIREPDMARARMAPPFSLTALDGKTFSLDDCKGKVVLIDFWATWCGPCREALPHLRAMAKKFDGRPLVILSVSLDTEEQKWKEFMSKNEMTWLQYRDGGFSGPISTLFNVHAIPHTFTIDADGVLQDEHVGDAALEGKLNKLIKRAEELQAEAKPQQ